MPVGKRLPARGVPNALADHEVLCTDNVVEAEAALSPLLGDVRIRFGADGRGEGFQATMNAVRLPQTALIYADLRAACTLSVRCAAEAFTVHMATHDPVRARVGAGEFTEVNAFRALVAGPGSAYVLDLGRDCPQLIMRIERDALERQLTRMLGRSVTEPVAFDPVGDLATDEAQRWHTAIQLLSSEIMSQGSLVQQGVGSMPIEELVISTLLYIQPSNYRERLRGTGRPAGRVAVRRAMEYIDDHLAERITLADLARHAGVSVRSIQAGFRDDLATTPVAYIRDRRLDQVRHVLLEALPSDGLTVGAVADRWGFGNAGTFAVRYRRRFGETPSETLRR